MKNALPLSKQKIEIEINAEKLTDVLLVQKACGFTINAESKMTLAKIYQCEHSPMRTQLFWIEMHGIPSFVSTHLVRHKIGVEHYVQSLRDDRGGTGTEGRATPVNHAMLANAQALVNMGRKRLCYKAHTETYLVMFQIKNEIAKLDKALSDLMVPECVYRNGCHEVKSCGYYDKVRNSEN
jgi:hypothetical protein